MVLPIERRADRDQRARTADDSDAMWRPGGATLLVEPGPGVDRDEPHDRPGGRRAADAPTVEISPWSREAVEAPLPTIDEVRARWRYELGLPTDGTRTPPPGEPGPRRAISVPGQPRSNVTGDVVLGWIVVACLVAAAALAVVVVRPTSSTPPTDVLPASTAVRWSVALGPGVTPASVAADSTSVVTVDAGVVAARDVATGLERWRRALPDSDAPVAVEIYDDTVVAVGAVGLGVWAAGYDLDVGTVRWERDAGSRTVALSIDGVVEYVDNGGFRAMRVLDPVTGTAIGPSSQEVDLPSPPGVVVGGTAEGYVALDVESGVVLGPAVPTFRVASIAPVADRVVAFTDDADLILYGPNGSPLDQRKFVSEAFGDFRGRAELVGGVPGTSIGIVASGTSIGIDVSDDRIDVLWEVAGRVGTPVETDLGPLAPARVVDPDTGQVDIAVVDVRDGSIVTITDRGTTRTADPVLVRDGYLAGPLAGDPDETISAVGYDGVERWSLATEGALWFELADGVLYVLDTDGRLTVHG